MDVWNNLFGIDGYGGSEAESLAHVAEDVIMFGVYLDMGGLEGNIFRPHLQRAAQIVQESTAPK